MLVAGIPSLLAARGWLVLAFAPSTALPPDPLQQAVGYLAQLIGLNLQREVDCRHCQDLAEELEEQRRVVTVGDAVLGLTHELSNSLNTMLLQASVVQLSADARTREELTPIRSEGTAIARRLRLLQQFREESRSAQRDVDLNHELRRAAAALPDMAERIDWNLASNPPALSINRGALRRLLDMLLRAAQETISGQSSSLRVETRRQNGGMELVLSGLRRGEKINHLVGMQSVESFERDADAIIERLAVESLLRLLEARLRLEQRSADTLAVILKWGGRGENG
jgi:hypothetical protein